MNQAKITKAKSRLMMENPYFGTLVSGLQMRINNDIAAVSPQGDLLEYNDEYLEVLNIEEVMSILANAAMHQALFHADRGQGRVGSLWHLASDYAINALLVENGFSLPPLANYSSRFERLYAEEIYSTLLGEQERPDLETTQEQTSEVSSSNDEPFFESLIDQEEYEMLLEQLEVKMAKQGELPKGIERFVKLTYNTQIAWRDELYRYVNTHAKSDYRMFPSSKKHLYRGIALPSIYGEELKIAVAIDTSASIEEALLEYFLSELYEIMQIFSNYRIELIECDATIQNIQSLTPLEPFTPQLKGGGGTDFRPVFDYLETLHGEFKFLIYFTDAEGVFPSYLPTIDTLWVIPEHSQEVTIPFGEVLYIKI